MATGQSSSVAEELFQRAKKLLAEGKVAEACEKLAESQRAEAASGTLLNLADCHVKEGKSATAWAEFIAAANLGKQQGKKGHVEEGNKRAKALEPTLSRLTVRVPQRVEGLKIVRGGEPLEASSFGTALPIDPGKQTISASAPGYRPWSTTITIAPSGDKAEVEVPPLEREAAGAPPTKPPSEGPPPSPSSDPKGAPNAGAQGGGRGPASGYVIGGLGIVALGVGGYFGLRAKASYDDAKGLCPTRKGCSQAAGDARETAGSRAMIANVGVGVGVVAVGVGVYLVATARSRDGGAAKGPLFAPYVARDGGGAAWGGSF